MDRNSQYQFVSTDTDTLVAELVSAYEEITGMTCQPASPEKLFIQWVANIIIQERVLLNYAGNQNIPSRAVGENLDALADLFLEEKRPAAQSAVATARFYITEPQSSAILVPIGTRVTDGDGQLIWETTLDAYVNIGETYVDVPIKCQTPGVIGNGYAVGQINTVVDIYDYCDRVTNTTISDEGADEATDDEFYEIMVASMDGFSCAGAKGGYIYFAKSVSTEIKDVVVNTPTDGEVRLYVLMNDGTPASDEIKAAVEDACNADEKRPLTDHVAADDPTTYPYTINFTYYVPTDSELSATEIEAAVKKAVDDYIHWQSGKLGRDINPSHLVSMLMQTGIKRVELTQPVYHALNDGSDNSVPQVAQIPDAEDITITNGGYEDE